VRNRYIVCYDIADAKRLRKVFTKMHGFGNPVQYSVFRCDLSQKEKFLMLDALTGLINQREDRVMVVDTGPADGRGGDCLVFLGRDIPPEPPQTAVVV
jgi:CRISPR-associated protein Cas2